MKNSAAAKKTKKWELKSRFKSMDHSREIRALLIETVSLIIDMKVSADYSIMLAPSVSVLIVGGKHV